jgi:hypothetical protein
MGRRAGLSSIVALLAAGCADTTCPAGISFSNAAIDLATTFHPPPRVATEVEFLGMDGNLLSFTDGVTTFDVSTRYADWAPITPGQRVVLWREDSDTSLGTTGPSISVFVAEPDTGALLFGVIATNGHAGVPLGRRTFADLAIDYEVACTAPPVDCTEQGPFAGPSPPVDGERLVVQTMASTVRVEVGETREVDGYRVHLETATSEAMPVFSAGFCDVLTGRIPRRGVVIARID